MHSSLKLPDLTIHKAMHETVGPSWSKDSFPYPHHRLYYVTGGEAKIVMKDRCLYLKKGYLYLLPAFMMVETICSDSFSHYYIHFRVDSLAEATYLTHYLPGFHYASGDHQQIFTLFETVVHHCLGVDLSSYLTSQGALFQLLAPFFTNADQLNYDLQRFIPVLNYIDDHLSDAIDLEVLAALVSLEKNYFANLFTKTFQVPPRQYINMRRLNRAQLELVSTTKRVKDIALSVGFESDMYFSRLFKAKFGMTPGTYRRSV